MRTIILNTLGEELRPDPLFFLPFREEELLWIHTDPLELSSAAGEIAGRLRRHSTRQSYHLVLLADLAIFPGTEYENMRNACRELVSAWFCHTVLEPLAGLQADLPVMVSEIFLYSGHIPGQRGIPDEERIPRLFGIPELKPDAEGLFVTYYSGGEARRLNMTDLFAIPWENFSKKNEESAEAGFGSAASGADEEKDPLRRRGVNHAAEYYEKKQAENLEWRRRQLSENIREQVEVMQHYRLRRSGKLDALEIDPQRFFFPVDEDLQELVMADLQINISRMVETTRRWRGKRAPPVFFVRTHSQEEMTEQFNLAELRLQHLAEHLPQQRYFSLNAERIPIHTEEVRAAIRKRLMEEHGNLLGVRAAAAKEQSGELSQEELIGKMKQSWFRLGAEKKQFMELFGQLRDQYDEEYVRREQDDVLDTCLSAFRSWRKDTMDGAPLFVPKEENATETVMPEMENLCEKIRDDLDDNQEEFTRAAADHLESYEDVREEGLAIRAEFEKRSKFWSPDALTRNLSNFQIFTGVMAVIFIVLMILPYVLIEAGTVGIHVSKTVVFGASLICFIVLYAVGLLRWLRQMCSRLHECTKDMAKLLAESGERRAESVEDQIRVYGELLPESIRLSEKQNYLAQIDRENQKREKNRIRHERLLGRALTRVKNLRTSLRIPAPEDYLSRAEQERLNLQLNKAPYEAENREIYLFFVDPVGKEET